MVAIQTLLLTLSPSLLTHASPTSLATRNPPPGTSAVTLRFFSELNTVCDAGGSAYETTTVLVPTAGLPASDFVTGTCYGQGPYGSVDIVTLQSGCKYEEYTTATCSDTPIIYTTNGCKLGNNLFPTYWKVTCT